MKPVVTFATGSEGPSHDPYSWDEVRVIKGKDKIVLRAGALGYTRLSVNGEKIGEAYTEVEEAKIVKVFFKKTGLNETTLATLREEWESEPDYDREFYGGP